VKKINKLPDIQKQMAIINLKIDRVGISNVRTRVKIRYDHKDYEFTPLVSAVVELPKDIRGTHMSRNSETIEEVIDEISHKPARKIEDITKNMALRLLEKHEYTPKVEVILSGILVIDVFQEDKGKVQKSMEIKIKTTGYRDKSNETQYNIQHLLSISIVGMIACPCGQELSREYARNILRSRKADFELDDEKIDNLLNLIPIATHSQRCVGTISIEIPPNYSVELLDLMNIIENSMSGITYNILKRVDEGRLIRYSHLNPRFVEDCIRIMALKLFQKYKEFPDSVKIQLRVESQESIHSHNAIAEIDTTIGNLRNTFNK